MKTPENDHAFRALQETAVSLGITVPDHLLIELYSIQTEHQFDKDRSHAIKKMQQRVLAAIDEQPSPNAGD